MKNLRYHLLGLFTCTIGTWAFGQSNNDVYNFYFQKGPAPQTVIQGGGGQKAEPAKQDSLPTEVEVPETASPPPQTTKTAIVPEQTKHDRGEHNYEIYLGITRLSDAIGTGDAYTLGFQYNFNRYIGARLDTRVLAVDTATYRKEILNPDDSQNRWGGSASLVFTPLRLELLGHQLLRVSATAGVLSERKIKKQTDNEVSVQGRGFVGGIVGMDINENVALEGSVALLDGGQVGQAIGSLVFSF